MAQWELEKSWELRYERWAALYKEDHQIAGWSSNGLSRRLTLVLDLISQADLRPSSLILDLGAGPGTYTRAMNHIGHHCVGVDYSRKVIEIARTRGSKEIYIQGEAYHLPFRNGSFNAVVCMGVLQSLARSEVALREMGRVLAPGGHLFLEGLSSLFWLHRFRCWRDSVRGEPKRMSYYDPYRILRETERLGFSDVRIHWLTAPEFLQPWFKAARENSLLAAQLAGYAFLLHGRKNAGGQGC